MSKHVRINKHTVMTKLRKGESWSGYLVGDNVNSAHITDNWYLGHHVSVSTIEELNQEIANFERNLEPELGSRAVLWT